MAAVCDLNPARIDVIGVRGGDKNEMIMNLKQNGVALDVSDMTLEAQARGSSTDTGEAPLIAVVTIVDGPTGRVSVRWPGAQVTRVLAGAASWAGVWDLQQTEEGEDPVTLIAGAFQAVQDVTK